MHIHILLRLVPLLLLAALPGQASVNAQELSVEPVIGTEKSNILFDKPNTRFSEKLNRQGYSIGSPVYIRVFKLPGILELWGLSDERFILLKTYSICNFSGFPGPKRYEGDMQSPEGIYYIHPDQLNPNSNYHLSFDIGFPNNYDKAQGYTGSAIMVHGGCSSSGCFALGNRNIEEVYFAVEKALEQGQKAVAIHIFPFALNGENLEKFSHSPWIEFWRSLVPVYNYFERNNKVPEPDFEKTSYAMGNRQYGPVL